MVPSMGRPWLLALLLALGPSAAVAKSAADYYVRSLPGVPEDASPVKMHAGHVEVTPEANGNFFFWHFQNKHIANRQRTVIWLNGGPGCSSEDGALMEVGPYRVKDQNTLTLNNGSWNEFANLLFVDNPVGAGFSYVNTDSYIHELDTMADQFVQFLEKFFEIFPEYDRDDIYIAGESYAGQYIPYIARAILDRNKSKGGKAWSLKGLLIGNGWISPMDQYPAYIKYALQKEILKRDSEDTKTLQDMQNNCDRMMAKDPNHVDYGECESVLQSLLKMTAPGTGDQACYNMYDVRLRDSYPSCGMNWPPDLTGVTPYLRRADVVEALHIDNQRNTGWQECSGSVSAAFKARKSRPAIDLLPDLMSEVPILLFSGAEDLICNHVGTEELISNMKWNGGKGFEVTPGNWAPRRNWTFESKDAGFWQEARNLTYVLFRDASHMVPFDFPRRSRDMLDRFMGVDISNIGGEPTDSLIDGEKGPETTVGGTANHTHTAEEEAQKKINDAKWAAYQRSGEVVLVIVTIVAVVWGVVIWRQRQKGASYSALSGGDSHNLDSFHMTTMRRRRGEDDLEASAFDETRLDNLRIESPAAQHDSKYSIGGDSDDEDEERRNGTGSGANPASKP